VEENAFPDRPSAVRASDADREAAVARLQIAVGEGRIDLDEFAQRADAAYAAVTAAELGVLLEDLPTTTSPSAEIIGTRRPEELRSVFGDVEVIVSEGVDAELDGWTLVGDRTTELAPVPRLAGTPRVVVQARTVFGDLRLRSLAPGNSPSRSLRRRCDSAALTLPF
jgi:hypothetical protein